MTPLILMDDVESHNRLLETLLNDLIAAEGLDAEVALTATDGRAVVEYAQTRRDGGLYFLDIELRGGESGVDICRRVHEADPSAQIVYVSAYPHYAMACLKSHAYDFLLKPFTHGELRDCLLALIQTRQTREIAHPLTVQMGSRTLVLAQEDITHIVARGNFLVAFTEENEYAWRASLKRTLPALAEEIFLRVSRSVAVNLRHIREVNWPDDTVTVTGGAVLPISRRVRDALRKRLEAEGRVRP